MAPAAEMPLVMWSTPNPLSDEVPNCLQSFSRLTSSEKTHSSSR